MGLSTCCMRVRTKGPRNALNVTARPEACGGGAARATYPAVIGCTAMGKCNCVQQPLRRLGSHESHFPMHVGLVGGGCCARRFGQTFACLPACTQPSICFLCALPAPRARSEAPSSLALGLAKRGTPCSAPARSRPPEPRGTSVRAQPASGLGRRGCHGGVQAAGSAAARARGVDQPSSAPCPPACRCMTCWSVQ